MHSLHFLCGLCSFITQVAMCLFQEYKIFAAQRCQARQFYWHNFKFLAASIQQPCNDNINLLQLPNDSPAKQRPVPNDSPTKQRPVPNDSPTKQHSVPNDSPAKQYPVPKNSPAKQCPVPNDSPAHFDQLPVPNDDSALTILQICVPMTTASTRLQADNDCHSSLNDVTAPQAFSTMTAIETATMTQVPAITSAITKAIHNKLDVCILHPANMMANNAHWKVSCFMPNLA